MGRTTFDMLIVGAGPAGSAAAICAAARGLDVGIVERQRFPRDVPGEALHPDVDRLFEALGVLDAIAGAGFIRFPGWFLEHASGQHWIRFDGPKELRLGYQAWRAELDALLLERARQVGARVYQAVNTRSVLTSAGRVVGIETDADRLTAGLLIDASGYRSWLSRQLGLPIERLSPNLVARYGYSECDFGLGTIPSFREHPDGWTWLARVRNDRCQLVQLSLRPGAAVPPVPKSYGFPTRLRGADVTWRIVRDCAGPGYLICGDAAAILDPAATGGVARAITTGMKAAEAAVGIVTGETDEAEAAMTYRGSIGRQFESEALALASRYARLENAPPWVRTVPEKLEA